MRRSKGCWMISPHPQWPPTGRRNRKSETIIDFHTGLIILKNQVIPYDSALQVQYFHVILHWPSIFQGPVGPPNTWLVDVVFQLIKRLRTASGRRASGFISQESPK